MGAIAERDQLINDVIALRRAERRDGAHEDIAAVRAHLEQIIGSTVTRSAAARLLGVSQTAFDRWSATGEIPTVITRSGRPEAPLHALVELAEALDEHRQAHPDDRHPLAAVLRGRRSQADGLTTSPLITDADHRHRAPADAHRYVELRSLAYHRAVARRLDQTIIRDARNRLERWRSQHRIDSHRAHQWQQILDQAPSQIARLIGADTPRMRDLRQSSPFAGTLSEPERRRALAAVAAATAR